jgi:outer membrane protein TolC
MAQAYYFPDLAVVGSAVLARAQGVDDPNTAFANDPFNRSQAGVVLALQWTIEPWNVAARVDRARAEARKAHAQQDLAALGARYDAETALAEATSAKAKLDAAVTGEQAGRAWVASVLQADAIGAADPKDLSDAYIAWFTIRGRWAQSVFQWNVAVVRVGRAGGEYRRVGDRKPPVRVPGTSRCFAPGSLELARGPCSLRCRVPTFLERWHRGRTTGVAPT